MRSTTGNLSGIIRDFKRSTSKQIMDEISNNPNESRKEWLEMIFQYHAKYNKRVKDKQFWTHENHAVELYTNEMIDSRIEYIHQNPVRAGWVEKSEDYLYSSACSYIEGDKLIEIDRI